MKLEDKLQEQFQSSKELLGLAMVGSYCNDHSQCPMGAHESRCAKLDVCSKALLKRQ